MAVRKHQRSAGDNGARADAHDCLRRFRYERARHVNDWPQVTDRVRRATQAGALVPPLDHRPKSRRHGRNVQRVFAIDRQPADVAPAPPLKH